MIVNENLSGQNSIILDSKDSSFRFGAFFLSDLGLVEGETYTFSAELTLSEGEEGTVILFDSDYKVNSKSTRLSTKERTSFTFVYKEGMTNKIACYAGVHGSTSGITARYTHIKLEKGDQMTPYLPHKSNVKVENQAIFLGGGYSKRFTHSKLKTSRNRPVKFGGALC